MYKLLHAGDPCPECGEPLVLHLTRSILALFRKQTRLSCPLCGFTAKARRRKMVPSH